MGQRLYLPTVGRFLSVDSVPGGSANAYDYCNADPVNCTDLNGTFAWKKLAGIVAAVASVASIVPGPIGMAASAVAVVAYVAAGDKKQAMIAAAGIVLAAVGAGVAVAAVRAGAAARAVETGVAAGRLAARAAPKVERGIYVVKDTRTGLPYVGMSKHISVRLAQHVAKGKITQDAANAAERYAVTGHTTLDLRVAEQKMIQRRGGVRLLANKINSVAPKHWKRYGI